MPLRARLTTRRIVIFLQAHSGDMTNPRVLIVTCKEDPHSDVVIRKMNEIGVPLLRLNSEDFPKETVVSVQLDHADRWTGSFQFIHSKRTLQFDDLRSIWYRRPESHSFQDGLTEYEAAFATQETQHFMQGIWAQLDCFWMNHPSSNRLAGYKPEQLARARRLGLNVPKSIITNNADHVRQFFHECSGQIITKAFTILPPFPGAAGGFPRERQHQSTLDAAPEIFLLASVKLTSAHLEQIDKIRYYPQLFQEYIPKAYELRITVIGDDVFACRIDSQNSSRGKHDWRLASFEKSLDYSATTLPQDVEEKLRKYVTSYGLTFAAIDMIVDPDGRYVFLENNPNGNYLFIEAKVPEFRLVDATISTLLKG
jgi:glutathione synthase/RimK-type ligase-like ATP-grasp enzyme